MQKGDTVNYHEIAGGKATSTGHIIKAIEREPNNYGGDVAWVSGKSGCVSMDNLSMATLEIVKVEAPKELATEQVNAVKEAFRGNFDAMGELEPRYKALTDIKLVEPTREQCKEARTVRLALVKTRTGTATTHKKLKAEALVFGRYLDGMKRAQLIACEKRESDLLEIEKHSENIEKERIVKLQASREDLLQKLEIVTMPANLGSMEESVWDIYYDGVYQDFKRRKVAERQAEEDRIAKEEDDRKERDRVHKENEKLKADEEERRVADEKARRRRIVRNGMLAPFLALIRDYDATIDLCDAEFEKEIETLRTEAIEQHRLDAEKEKAIQRKHDQDVADRKAIEDQNRKEREEAAAKIRTERQAREKLELENTHRLEKEQLEREIKEDEAKKEAERVADVKNRDSVHADIECSLGNYVDETTVKRLVAAIAGKQIPHVTINY